MPNPTVLEVFPDGSRMERRRQTDHYEWVHVRADGTDCCAKGVECAPGLDPPGDILARLDNSMLCSICGTGIALASLRATSDVDLLDGAV